jgi:hypothetical protein
MAMKKRSIVGLLTACFLSAGMVGTTHAVPVQWTTASGGNGHWYDVVSYREALWTSARTAAQGLGAGWDLATITSADEQTFINSQLPSPGASGTYQYWVGGLQANGAAEPGGNWQWINNEGTFWNSGSTGMYTNWGSTQPDNYSPRQNYLALDNRYTWGWDDNDANFKSVIRGYVAETAAVPEPSTLLLLGSGLLGLVGLNRRRKA